MACRCYLYLFVYDSKDTRGFVPIIPSNEMFVCEVASDNYQFVGDVFNEKLGPYLAGKNIMKFIPAKRPSINNPDEPMSMIYYHDVVLHDKIYLSHHEYVMEPAGDLRAHLCNLYQQHGFWDGDDARLFAAFTD